jgi:hypothetical protein
VIVFGMRTRGLAGGLALALAVALPGAAPAAAEDDTWYAETLSSSPRGIHATQYWAKGRERMRAETVIAGHRLVSIVNGDLYYAVDATDGKVVAITRSARARKEDARRPRLIGIEGFVIRERGGEVVKSERLAGRACDVWRLTDQRGRREVWVQSDSGDALLPLRVEVYNRQAGVDVRTDYIQWARGLELAERLFLPDPRFSVETMDYAEYVRRSGEGELLVPVLHANLLHGEK